MTSSQTKDEATCADCGTRPVRMVLATVPLCDGCFDARIAAETGWPRLPQPPPPERISGSDGRRHRIGYRVWRSPSGIVVEAMEGDPLSDGYYAEIVGPHDADVAMLVERAKLAIRRRIDHVDLEVSPSGYPIMAGMDLLGRLVWEGDGEPYGVVVDGRHLSWSEFGRALEPFEGWEFRLRFGDDRTLDDEADPSGQNVSSLNRPASDTRLH